MKTEYSMLNRVLSSLIYHAESWGIISNKYPKQITQKVINKDGVIFEVDNIVEANRVRFLDDEKGFLSELLDSINNTDVFYDIGACIGLYSLHVATYSKQVIAFEPEPAFRDHLFKNITINNVTNITVLPYAVSEQSGNQLFFTDGISGKSPSLMNDGFLNKIEVEVKTLDDIIEQNKLPFPTVIKMDIEGAEILALLGMRNLFEQNPPRLLFLEVHPIFLKNFNSSTDEVFSIIKSSGYQVVKEYKRDDQIHIICLYEN